MNEPGVGIQPEAPAPATLTFEVSDVTGTHTVIASNVQASLSAAAVARSLAATMSLPANVPWALRDQATGAYLDDAKPIGDQVRSQEPMAKLSVTPKAHLG